MASIGVVAHGEERELPREHLEDVTHRVVTGTERTAELLDVHDATFDDVMEQLTLPI